MRVVDKVKYAEGAVMTQHTSDVKLGDHTSSVRAVFRCEGNSVTVTFMDAKQQVGQSKTFSRAEASKLGQRAEETGLYDYLPLELPSEYVKNFGIVFRRYGEKGC
jgi:hypothetical protein